ncbi:restriction endonuclease [Halorarum salinum]|uniref:Restriction endonuclease n=1 Tax=Halorarum salinum TaxID=2743089 RepID=A0A7D5QBW7_9EURY|nr:restriction endonuclease [Halobaculum salinum]QLG61181.1 restriction endonuclease [Halobaculum salinum]
MGGGTIKRRLQGMDNYDFEHFVADLWERQGWNCEVSAASVDAGVDVTATKSTPYAQKKLIQAKRYGPNTTVGGPDVQRYASLKHQQPDADSVVVVTTNSFTGAAEDRARELNVKLVDGDDLAALVVDLEAVDLLDRYAPRSERGGARSDDGPVGDGGGPDDPEAGRPSTADGSGLRDGDGTLSPESSPGWLHRLERARQWHRLVPLGLVLWFVAVGAVGALAGAGGAWTAVADLLGFGVVLPLVVAVPVAWYLDVRYVRAETEWSPAAPRYLLGSLLLAGLPMLYYYYRRYRTIGL